MKKLWALILTLALVLSMVPGFFPFSASSEALASSVSEALSSPSFFSLPSSAPQEEKTGTMERLLKVMNR